jgi:hypothetical protein
MAAMLVPASAHGAIVYVCGYNLCRVNGDGSGQAQLTTNGTAGDAYGGPSLNQEGTKLSFDLNDRLALAEASAQIQAGPFENDRSIYTELNPDGSQVAVFEIEAGMNSMCLRETAAPANELVCGRNTTDPQFSFGWAPSGQGMLYSVPPVDDVEGSHATSPEEICLADEAPRYYLCNRQVAADPGYDLTFPAASPNGSEIVVVASAQPGGTFGEGSLLIYSFATGALVRTLDGSSEDANPAWSPNGKTIVFSRGGALYDVPSEGGTPQMVAAVGQDPTWGGAETQTSGGGGNGGGGSGGGGTVLTGVGAMQTITHLGIAAHSVRTGRAVTFEVTLASAATITIELLRHVPASGHGRHRHPAHYVALGTLRFAGKDGLNRLAVEKLHGHKLAAGAYEAKVSAGGTPQTLTFTVRS